MALLQIAEPGLSAAPHQRKLAVGIDLGTTNSLVATVRSGQAETLGDNNNQHLLPSVVSYTADNVVVGEQAKRDASLDPANTIVSVKRFLGRSLNDIRSSYPDLPYDFDESNPNSPLLNVTGRQVNPVEVSSEILTALRLRAEQSLGEELSGAVVTVPAYFDDAQRQGTKDAAQLAGLNPGMVIIRVGQVEVTSLEIIDDSIKNAIKQKRKALLLLVKVENGTRFVALELK